MEAECWAKIHQLAQSHEEGHLLQSPSEARLSAELASAHAEIARRINAEDQYCVQAEHRRLEGQISAAEANFRRVEAELNLIQSEATRLRAENKVLRAKTQADGSRDRDAANNNAEGRAALQTRVVKLTAENSSLRAKTERLAAQERELLSLAAGTVPRHASGTDGDQEAGLVAELLAARQALAQERVNHEAAEATIEALRRQLEALPQALPTGVTVLDCTQALPPSMWDGLTHEPEVDDAKIVTQERMVEHLGVQLIERIEEVPQIVIQTVDRHVSKVEYQEVVTQVPKYQVQYQERLVEHPETQIIERIEEVPQIIIQTVDRHVTKIEYQEVVRQVPKIEIVMQERIVEVPELQVVERVVEVPQTMVQVGDRHMPKAARCFPEIATGCFSASLVDCIPSPPVARWSAQAISLSRAAATSPMRCRPSEAQERGDKDTAFAAINNVVSAVFAGTGPHAGASYDPLPASASLPTAGTTTASMPTASITGFRFNGTSASMMAPTGCLRPSLPEQAASLPGSMAMPPNLPPFIQTPPSMAEPRQAPCGYATAPMASPEGVAAVSGGLEVGNAGFNLGHTSIALTQAFQRLMAQQGSTRSKSSTAPQVPVRPGVQPQERRRQSGGSPPKMVPQRFPGGDRVGAQASAPSLSSVGSTPTLASAGTTPPLLSRVPPAAKVTPNCAAASLLRAISPRPQGAGQLSPRPWRSSPNEADAQAKAFIVGAAQARSGGSISIPAACQVSSFGRQGSTAAGQALSVARQGSPRLSQCARSASVAKGAAALESLTSASAFRIATPRTMSPPPHTATGAPPRQATGPPPFMQRMPSPMRGVSLPAASAVRTTSATSGAATLAGRMPTAPMQQIGAVRPTVATMTMPSIAGAPEYMEA